MRDDERRVDLAALDPLQQGPHVTLDVGLSHAAGQYTASAMRALGWLLSHNNQRFRRQKTPAIGNGEGDDTAFMVALFR
jgi:hypothetical protein